MTMQGLREEAQDLLAQLEDGPVADAAIIGAGQDQVANLLEATLQEEKSTDEKLTRIATGSVNQRAAQAQIL